MLVREWADDWLETIPYGWTDAKLDGRDDATAEYREEAAVEGLAETIFDEREIGTEDLVVVEELTIREPGRDTRDWLVDWALEMLVMTAREFMAVCGVEEVFTVDW